MEAEYDTFRKYDKTVDRSLIAMFLRMTPDERIDANDNAIRAIEELRDAFCRQTIKASSRRSEPNP